MNVLDAGGRAGEKAVWLPPGAEALMDTRPGNRVAEELAALRRVAVLVARGAPPEEIFTAVTAEVGRLLDADLTAMARYDADGARTIIARRSAAGEDLEADLRRVRGGGNIASLVFETGRRRAWTTTLSSRVRPPMPPASLEFARASGCRLASRGGCGAS